MTRSLHEALDKVLSVVESGLGQIMRDEGGVEELKRALLLNLLELAERDPGLEAAADDLYSVAQAVASGPDKGPRMARLMAESLLRFRDRLAAAMPSQLARHMGLE